MTAAEIQVLYAEANCFRCLSGASDVDLIRLALLARITDALGVSGAAVYSALLTQSGVSAPVATVLQNTLGGTVVWSYSSVGLYIGTLTGAFPVGTTFVMIDQSNQTSHIYAGRADNNSIQIITRSNANVLTDTILTGTSLEVRVYS